MLDQLLEFNPALSIPREVVEFINKLVAPQLRLATIIALEERDLVMIRRCEMVMGSRVQTVPGRWDVMIVTGDFAGTVIDECSSMSDAMEFCEALELDIHAVEM